MADVASNLYSWSTTASSNAPAGGTAVGTGLDDNLREIQKVVRQDLATKGSDIASATSTDLGAVAGLMHDITGTTTITGFGTVAAGIWKIIKFEDALTLTHNATSLILPGGANITTTNGDVAIMFSEGSGNWRCVSYSRATPFASAAETLTGSITSKPMTPGGFAGNLDITGSAGYYKLPGGLIFQWDSITTDASGDVTWTYPTAFSTAAFIVVANAKGGDAGLMISTDAPGTTTCALYVRQHDNAQPSTVNMSVFAVGV